MDLVMVDTVIAWSCTTREVRKGHGKGASSLAAPEWCHGLWWM